MFGKKLHADIKKSTQKIQDAKKDSATRLKHLRIVLEHTDTEEAKSFFEINYSHIYYIFYDSFINTETNLKQKELPFHLVHKAHREELETVLHLLDRILVLCPELIAKRWQCHSLTRIISKLLHPGNSWKLRREAIRYFVLWYQAVGDNAPDSLHGIFATLVPGFTSPILGSPGLTPLNNPPSATVFHDSFHGAVKAVELCPVYPPQSGEKQPGDPMRFFLDSLLEFMVTQLPRIEWRDKSSKQLRCFTFLFERFKQYYLPIIFPEFSHGTSLYKTALDTFTMRIREDKRRPEPFGNCRVAFIKWIANFTHVTKGHSDSVLLLMRSSSVTPSEGEGDGPELRRVSVGVGAMQNVAAEDAMHNGQFVTTQDSNQREDPNSVAFQIVREVLYGSRENVNFVHEVYRQAFLLNFTYAPAIRRAIAVYKDWIQMNYSELPPFMMEPLDFPRNSGPPSSQSTFSESTISAEEAAQMSRLRNDSYLGAIHRENLMVRAGLQSLLQLFIGHAANVFLLDVSSEYPLLLEEQVDICKRVLNIYRYMVMHTHMEARTWEQLLIVLLQITSLVLSKSPPKQKEDTLGGRLAPAIFQTLIVTWIKANLNVFISSDLWDQFLTVLSSLTQWEELIREWAKTLDTLTRVLARHVYSLDLTDLPLERLSEQKIKKQRRGGGAVPMRYHSDSQPEVKQQLEEQTDGVRMIKDSTSWSPLRRSASESNISYNRRRSNRQRAPTANLNSIPVLPTSVEQEVERILAGSTCPPRQNRLHQKSCSMDSLRGIHGRWGSVNCEFDCPTRTPSPAPSSGVESNSLKDSPIQIDVLANDGTSMDEVESEHGGSVMSGGVQRGWLPEVAVVLWRRMLAALGDVNGLRDPALHAHVFAYLVELNSTLAKIRQNQGIPGDSQATPAQPELVPPITLIAPWCFQAISLPEQYQRGKLSAYRLLCQMTLATHDVALPSAHVTQFYTALHRGLISTDQSIVNTLIRYCGARFFSLQLPGFSLLLLDFIHAANTVVSSNDLKSTPREHAMSILGSLLSLPLCLSQLPVLQPRPTEFVARPCPEARDHVVNILLRSGKTENTGMARCIALSSLGIFLYQELGKGSGHPKIKEALNTLLLALRFNHKTVALIASDILLLLCDHSQTLLQQYPGIPPRIVEVLAGTLAHLLPVGEADKRLLTSLVFCLGEWTMHLPQNVLLQYYNNSCLLHSVFKVLVELSEGGKGRAVSLGVGGSFHPDLVQEFNANIVVDDLNPDRRNPATNRKTSPLSHDPASPPLINSTSHSIQLAAKMVIMHLLNHVGHFPLAIGAARLCSLVVEQDDVPGLQADQLSPQLFTAPNIQLFLMSNKLLMSLVELPLLEVPGGGVTAGLVTAGSQVRVILRDLAGKASWDASILYCTPGYHPDRDWCDARETVMSPAKLEESMLNSCLVTTLPQHTMRHRPPHLLPTHDNSAPDLDNLDDLLQYVGHTSPECLENLETKRNIPAPPLNPALEQEVMSSVLGQRFAEHDYAAHSAAQPADVVAHHPQQAVGVSSPFQHCRLLFSQLGLAGWERRNQLYLLDNNDKLLRELKNLDSQRCRETHKIAVIYVAEGQEDKNSILSNAGGSQAYEDFIAGLAWEVELESHTGFMGGLQRNKTTGVTAPYYATSFIEAIFHVSTRIPSSSHEALLQKTRHLGNDEVHIVWSEHSRDYRRGILPTEFCDVLIVIYPLQHSLYRIQVSRKPEVPYFGPLFNEAIVEHCVLAGLVRTTAICASRAKRSMLPFYQQYYEERARSLETVTRNHKKATTFEEFAAQVYSPVLSPSPFGQGPARASGASWRSVEGSAVSHEVPPSSNLAAALIDSQPQTSLRQRINCDMARLRGADGGRVSFFGADGDTNVSPKPLKKLVLKTGPRKLPTNSTPPDSPTARRAK